MSADIQVDVYGIPELRMKLDRLDTTMRQRVDEVMEFEVQAMQNTAESLAPKRTGRLARSIVARRLREWSFQLLALAPYAAAVEFGTRYMIGRRFLSRTLEIRMPSLILHINGAIRDAIVEAGSS